MWTTITLLVLLFSGARCTHFCFTPPNENFTQQINPAWRHEFNVEDPMFRCSYAKIGYWLVEVPIELLSHINDKYVRIPWGYYEDAHNDIVNEILSKLKTAGLDKAVWNLVSDDFELIPVNWNISFDFGLIKQITGEDNLEELKDILVQKLNGVERSYTIQVAKKDIQLKFTNKVCGVLLIIPESAIVVTISEKDRMVETLKSTESHPPGHFDVCAPDDHLRFLVYKQSNTQDQQTLVGQGSGTTQGFCEMVRRRFNQERFWYNHHFHGCTRLERLTEIPSLIARISFDYTVLGDVTSHESCYKKISEIINSIIHTTPDGELVDEPAIDLQVVGIRNPLIVPDPRSHSQEPFKYNPICLDLKWMRANRNKKLCLHSQYERHQIEVPLSGKIMDPIRWNMEPEHYSPFYDQAWTYIAQSLSKSLQNMGLLNFVLTMKPGELRVQDGLGGLVGDLRLLFDLFSLGAELQTEESERIIRTLSSKLQMPEKIDEAYTFQITGAQAIFSKETCGIPLPKQKVQAGGSPRRLVYSSLYEPHVPALRKVKNLPRRIRCFQTGPVLTDMRENPTNLPDLSKNLFWCLHVGTEWVRFGYRTIDVSVKIQPRETSPGASVVQMVSNADAYRSSVALLKKFLIKANIYNCVWYLMPVDFTSANPNWKVSFDLLSLARRFQTSDKSQIHANLKAFLETAAQVDDPEFTVDVLDTFEKFTRNMCGVPLVNPECEGTYCFTLDSYASYDPTAESQNWVTEMVHSDVYNLVDIIDRCEPGEDPAFIVFYIDKFQRNPEYEQLTNLASVPSSADAFCAKVPEMLGRHPFWFRESFKSCSSVRDAANKPFLFARIHMKPESLGWMQVDQQCLEMFSEEMEKALNTRPDGTVADVFHLRAVPPIRSFITNQIWLEDHKNNPLKYNPVCFKTDNIEVTEVRLFMDTQIPRGSGDVADIAAIKTHLDQHVSRMDSPSSFAVLKTEIGAFEVDGNKFKGQYNIITMEGSQNRQKFVTFQSKVNMQVSVHRVLALKFDPPIHRIVVWLEKQIETSVGGGGNVGTSNSDTILDSFDNQDEPESNGMEQQSHDVAYLLKAFVGRLQLKESLLAIRVDKCKTDVNTVCNIRLFFDLFKLGLRLKASDVSEAVRLITDLIQREKSIEGDRGFKFKGVQHDVSDITIKRIWERIDLNVTPTD